MQEQQVHHIPISPQQIQFIGALLHSPPDEWEKQYWRMRFQETLLEKDDGYPKFDFEYTERRQFYRFINSGVIAKQPIDYLEFGVAGGDSFRSWMKLNTHAESTFNGFDSFEGLPEHWHENATKGAYSAGGKVPNIEDKRGRFHKGLFQQTLPNFVAGFKPSNRLVIHMDADLYSSTLYALTMLDPFIAPGTIILFDEFLSNSGSHEFAALYDYSRTYYKQWRIVAARTDHNKLAIEII